MSKALVFLNVVYFLLLLLFSIRSSATDEDHVSKALVFLIAVYFLLLSLFSVRSSATDEDHLSKALVFLTVLYASSYSGHEDISLELFKNQAQY